MSALEDDLRHAEAKCRKINRQKEELIQQLTERKKHGNQKVMIEAKDSQTLVIDVRHVAVQTSFDSFGSPQGKGVFKGDAVFVFIKFQKMFLVQISIVKQRC